MKKLRLIIAVSAMMLFAAACNTSDNKSANKSGTEVESVPSDAKITEASFTCPMHPEVVSDVAGDCPKCGMKLVPVDSTNTPHRDSI